MAVCAGAGRYVDFDPATGAFSMTQEQAFALANPDRRRLPPERVPAGARGAQGRAPYYRGIPHGAGLGWFEHDEDVFAGCELFFRPGYAANLVPSWIHALRGCAYSGLGL